MLELPSSCMLHVMPFSEEAAVFSLFFNNMPCSNVQAMMICSTIGRPAASMHPRRAVRLDLLPRLLHLDLTHPNR